MGEQSNVPLPDPHVPQTEGLQIGDHRLSTLCGVVERPDRHCGDNLGNQNAIAFSLNIKGHVIRRRLMSADTKCPRLIIH